MDRQFAHFATEPPSLQSKQQSLPELKQQLATLPQASIHHNCKPSLVSIIHFTLRPAVVYFAGRCCQHLSFFIFSVSFLSLQIVQILHCPAPCALVLLFSSLCFTVLESFRQHRCSALESLSHFHQLLQPADLRLYSLSLVVPILWCSLILHVARISLGWGKVSC